MDWHKSITQEQHISTISTAAIFFCLFGIVFISDKFFFIGLLYGLFLFFHHLYDKYSGRSLQLMNKRVRQRLLVGDEKEFLLQFENYGLPIINGTLEITFNQNLKGVHHEVDEIITIPFTIYYKQKLTIPIPSITIKRGVGRIKKIAIVYKNPLGFSEIYLEYQSIWQEELIILPKMLPIDERNWEQLILRDGNQTVPTSVFEDRLLTVGTRNYLHTDAFHNVHWKASAKLNQLQTKVFEKTTDLSAMILLNVADGYWWNDDLERMISHIAYFTNVLNKENIPYSLAVNLRSFSGLPYFYLPVGEGRTQLERALEMLAIIDTHQMIMPYEKMLFYLKKQYIQAPFIVHAGILTKEQEQLIKDLGSFQSTIFTLNVNRDMSELKILS